MRADDSTTPAAAPAPRIVGCDDPVQSQKRGVCENNLSDEDFRALAPGVSWYYNWHYETANTPPDGVNMQFIPMAWGHGEGDADSLDGYLSSANNKPRVVLVLNEPNLKGQSFMPPEKAAELYKKFKDVADKYQLTVVGPNMALGSASGDSIKAMDPILHKQFTYTFMVPFLLAFNYYLNNPGSGDNGGGDSADASTPSSTDTTNAAPSSDDADKELEKQSVNFPAPLGVHSYGGLGELKWAVTSLHQQFNCPIWVTEYAFWKASDVNEARDFLIQSTDFLESTPYVQGYAWFKERSDKNPKISLLDKQPGVLSPLGQAYVALPSHDADLYYRIPGKLSAAKYVTADGATIMATQSNNFLMSSISAGATLSYNINVDTAGTFKIDLKVVGSGKVDLLENGQTLGSATINGDDVQDLVITTPLPAGTQTLQVRLENNGDTLSTIDFENQ